MEVTRAGAPALTLSMRIALDDLGLERLLVLYPSQVSYGLADLVMVLPLENLARGKAENLLSRSARDGLARGASKARSAGGPGVRTR